MESIQTAFEQILQMLFQGDKETYEIIFMSLQVSLTATVLGTIIGIPLGTLLGLKKFPGRRVVINLIYTLMGLPPVLAGLLVYLLLSRTGPLGSLQLLFTPSAMVIAQVLLVTPIITGLTTVAVQAKERYFSETAVTLGAVPWQAAFLVVREARGSIVVGIITAFGRAIAEVGAVMLVGGNIQHFTRVMTTAIVLETRKGDYNLALGLGLVLLLLSFTINGILYGGLLQFAQRGEHN